MKFRRRFPRAVIDEALFIVFDIGEYRNSFAGEVRSKRTNLTVSGQLFFWRSDRPALPSFFPPADAAAVVIIDAVSFARFSGPR